MAYMNTRDVFDINLWGGQSCVNETCICICSQHEIAGINHTLCLASQNHTLRELIFQFVLVEISFHEGYVTIIAFTLKQSDSFTVLSMQISL